MVYRFLVALSIVLIWSCSQQTSRIAQRADKDHNQNLSPKSGLKIEYGPNLGAIDKYTAGDYIYITATIMNDTTVPIDLQIAISEEFNFPDSCSHYKYKVFLLPKELTPDTATFFNNITDGVDDFLERCLDSPYVLDKILEPGEYSVITIGTLLPRPAKCFVSALPRAVFAQIDDHSFQECDSQMNQDKFTTTQLALGVKFVFYRGKSKPETCVLHPCGQFSYLE